MTTPPASSAHGGLPPATAYHRLPFRLANAVLRPLSRLGIGHADLSEAGLIAAAQKATGLQEFGDDDFREPMRLALRDLDEEADLNPLGRMLTRQSLLRILKHRLWAHDLFLRHPEILERELRSPVVIVGLARTGTTKLHRLLACDPGFYNLRAWESFNPVPWPESFGAEKDPRQTTIEQGLRVVLYLSPQMQQVHPLGANEVEEEVGFIEHAFSSQLFEVQHKMPNFADWLMNNDQLFAYEYMEKMFKLNEWFNQREPGTWILKSPQHMQDLDSLLRIFPDAKIICTHRDPLKAVGSACSMAWNAMVRDTDHLDSHWVGRHWCDKTESMVAKTQRIRDAQPAEQFIDVLFADVHKDPLGEIHRIYDFLGRELSDEAESAMLSWIDDHPQHAGGVHTYSLQDFGLDPERVEEQFADYRRRFSIPVE